MHKSLKTKEYSYTAVYEPVSTGGYQVLVPILPGLVTYGRTFEEAREMVRDAIQCHLEAIIKDNDHIPVEKPFVQERVFVSL